MWLLLFTNAAFTIPLITEKKYLVLIAPLVGMLPWIISVAYAPEKKEPPIWVSQVAALPQMYETTGDMTPMAQALQKDIKTRLSNNPDVDMVILPESAFNNVNFETAHELGEYWNKEALGKPIHMLFGAFKWEGDNYRNTVYWLYNGKIKASFNKRHAMALTEEIKGWYNVGLLRNLFHKESAFVKASDNPRVPFIINDVALIPYICSELFFNDQPDDEYPHATIAALCNDRWSSSPYIRHLMFLAARFKAIEWQRPILYVAYHYNGYINTDGTITPLK